VLCSQSFPEGWDPAEPPEICGVLQLKKTVILFVGAWVEMLIPYFPYLEDCCPYDHEALGVVGNTVELRVVCLQDLNPQWGEASIV